MILHPPFTISSALSPAIKLDEHATLTLLDTEPVDGWRDRARFEIHTEHFTHIDEELRSGVGGFRSTVEIFETFLSFLESAVEGYGYQQRTGRESDSSNLFPPHVVEWAADHADEITQARCAICDEDGNPNTNLIEE